MSSIPPLSTHRGRLCYFLREAGVAAFFGAAFFAVATVFVAFAGAFFTAFFAFATAICASMLRCKTTFMTFKLLKENVLLRTPEVFAYYLMWISTESQINELVGFPGK